MPVAAGMPSVRACPAAHQLAMPSLPSQHLRPAFGPVSWRRRCGDSLLRAQNERQDRSPGSKSPVATLQDQLKSSLQGKRQQSAPGRRPSPPPPPPEKEPGTYGPLDLRAYLQPWDVPWGLGETALGLVSWSLTFAATGLFSVTLLRWTLGSSVGSLPMDVKALFILLNQMLGTGVTLGLLWLFTRRHSPLPADLFSIDPRAPFRPSDGWLLWALVGIALSPLVVIASATAAAAIWGSAPSDARGTVDSISQLINVDGSTRAALLTTTAVLAPVLEESVFRGFLLPSLTRVLPVPLAVLASSAAFGLIHLTPRDFPQLTALGILMGFSYVRTRNLLTPILIHGAWNGGVLSILYAIAAGGGDVQELLRSGL
ncbi:CPL13 [Auxenochlorella protothecoides x Auxenochlorella symbiontica]